MIRLRKIDGTSMIVPADVRFVELVNDVDGTVMVVLFQVEAGAVLKINPGSSDAVNYENLFRKHGVAFATTMIERAGI